MSVDEMKIEAIRKITLLNDEGALKEILAHLEKLRVSEPGMLSRHYDEIKKQYHSVLEKLAR